jgi:hypothetical protein
MILTKSLRLFLLILATLAVKPVWAQTADTIYFGGPIVTMIRAGDRSEALAIKLSLIHI